MRRYLLNTLIALDQLGNVLLAGNNPDETISSAVGRKAMAGKRWALRAERAIDALFVALGSKPGHCRRMIEWAELPAAIAAHDYEGAR